MKKAGLYDQIPKKVWSKMHRGVKQDWVIDIEPVGNGLPALKYLAPYIFRTSGQLLFVSPFSPFVYGDFLPNSLYTEAFFL